MDPCPGFLRLHAFVPLTADSLVKSGNTLTQRCFRSTANTVTVRLELGGLADGQHAGLCHFSAGYAGLGVSRSAGSVRLTLNVDGALSYGPTVTGAGLRLRSTWDVAGVSQLAYSLDGVAFTAFGATYQMTWAGYRGDRIGVFTYNPQGTGYVDVDSFQYTVAPARAYTVANRNSSRLLDVRGRSTSDGAAVIQYRSTGGDNQRWAFQSTADGYHTVTCLRSVKLLTAGAGTAVVQSTGTGTADQQWQLVGNGPAYGVRSRATGLLLDVAAAAPTDGAAVVQSTAVAGAASQQWTFTKV